MVGDGATLATSAALADVDGPLGEVEEACAAGLLSTSVCATPGSLAFADPLVRAAVYGQLRPALRLRLHREAALVDDERAALHHRAAAAQPPDDTLADELQRFSDRSRSVRAVARGGVGAAGVRTAQRAPGAARAAAAARGRPPGRRGCCHRHGDPGTWGRRRRTARCAVTNGYIALVQGRAAEAHSSLSCRLDGPRPGQGPRSPRWSRSGWRCTGRGGCQGAEVVEWARRALELAAPEDPVRVEALALLGLGLGWVGWPPAPHRAPTVDDARSLPGPERRSRSMSTRSLRARPSPVPRTSRRGRARCGSRCGRTCVVVCARVSPSGRGTTTAADAEAGGVAGDGVGGTTGCGRWRGVRRQRFPRRAGSGAAAEEHAADGGRPRFGRLRADGGRRQGRRGRWSTGGSW